MNMEVSGKNTQEEWPIFDLWVEYEKTAAQFNDLLMRLRLQALAAVAVISAVVGLFRDGESIPKTDWLVATAIFTALSSFWAAIFIVDMFYYNRLLRGAASAIIDLEKLSKTGITHVKKIDLSIKIHESVEGKVPAHENGDTHRSLLKHPVTYFYLIVFLTLLSAVYFSYHNYVASNV